MGVCSPSESIGIVHQEDCARKEMTLSGATECSKRHQKVVTHPCSHQVNLSVESGGTVTVG